MPPGSMFRIDRSDSKYNWLIVASYIDECGEQIHVITNGTTIQNHEGNLGRIVVLCHPRLNSD